MYVFSIMNYRNHWYLNPTTLLLLCQPFPPIPWLPLVCFCDCLDMQMFFWRRERKRSAFWGLCWGSQMMEMGVSISYSASMSGTDFYVTSFHINFLKEEAYIKWASTFSCRSHLDFPYCQLSAHFAIPGSEVPVWQLPPDYRWWCATEEDVPRDLGDTPDTGLSVRPQSPRPQGASPGVPAGGQCYKINTCTINTFIFHFTSSYNNVIRVHRYLILIIFF